MNTMTELGLYILAILALAILAAAGLMRPEIEWALPAALLSAGSAYLSQLFAVYCVEGRRQNADVGLSSRLNTIFMGLSLIFWILGALNVIGVI